jgi:hypothetical protein
LYANDRPSVARQPVQGSASAILSRHGFTYTSSPYRQDTLQRPRKLRLRRCAKSHARVSLDGTTSKPTPADTSPPDRKSRHNYYGHLICEIFLHMTAFDLDTK